MRSGRHHAPGRADLPAGARQLARVYGQDVVPSATAIATNSTTAIGPLQPPAWSSPAMVAGRPPGGDDRDARSPLVHRLPVPSGVHLHPARWPCRCSRVSSRRARVQVPAAAERNAMMKLLRFRGRPGSPPLPDRRPLRDRERGQLALETAGYLQELTGRNWAFPSSSNPPSTRPTVPRIRAFAAPAWRKGLRILEAVRARSACRC
jgi:hypothetical protein